MLPRLTSFAKHGVAIVIREATDTFDRVRFVLFEWLLQGGRCVGLGGGAMDRASDRIEKRRGMRVDWY